MNRREQLIQHASPMAARLVVVLVTAGLVGGCAREPETLDFAGPTMGTTYHVTVRPMHGVGRETVQSAIDSVLVRVEHSLSTYDDASEISRFNRSASTDWIVVSADLYDVVAAAVDVSEQTDGAFDITVAPLLRLWGFVGNRSATSLSPTAAPSAEVVRSVLASTDYRHLDLQTVPRAVRKSIPDLHIDVDGIAPGYAVDQVGAAFDALGVTDYIIEIGGEVLARGRGPQQRPWRVAIEQPVMSERRPYAIAELNDRAISTSGDYRDVRIVAGRRVSHTIDPHSGEPVANKLTSISVMHDSAMMADAFATALMAMGPQAGFEFASRHGLAALFLVRAQDGSLRERSTDAFRLVRRPLRGADGATRH